MGWLAPSYGIKVSIHDRRIMPQPQQDGIIAMPGFETSVSFSKEKIYFIRNVLKLYSKITVKKSKNNFFPKFTDWHSHY